MMSADGVVFPRVAVLYTRQCELVVCFRVRTYFRKTVLATGFRR